MGYFYEVRKAVCRIPVGKVASYGDVARAAGYPGAARQVARALRHADDFGIPWHRVVGSGGRILLKAEPGELQRRLLEREGVLFAGDRADMRRCGFTLRAKAQARISGRGQSRPHRDAPEDA